MFSEIGETYLHAVKVEHFEIDFDFYNAYLELDRYVRKNQVPIDLLVMTECIKREDTAGWKIDYFNPSVSLAHWDTNEIRVARNKAQLHLAFTELLQEKKNH